MSPDFSTFAFVDGSSYSKNAGGWGAVVISDEEGIRHIYRPMSKNAVSSRTEMEAIISVLELLSPCHIIIHTDQQTVVNRCTNWRCGNPDSLYIPRAIGDKDLWERLKQQFERHEGIQFVKVKSGHNVFHNMAHDLASTAREEARGR